MLSNAPVGGSPAITHHFGDNPEQYANMRCGGVPVRGHTGIDYAVPPGTPVLAVQSGTVLSTGATEGRLGQFVLLSHDWGQSLYAYLSSINVQPGQSISAGEQIARSGSTGIGEPHLHFGMRIAPFGLGDGWCGYSDPSPYLDRLTQSRGAIIGPHIVGGIPQQLDKLRRWQPRLVLVLDPNPDEVRLLRQACPDTVIIGRVFEEDSIIDNRIRQDPAEAARWAHDKVMGRMSPDVDYWQFANEILQNRDSLPLLNQFEIERMKLAEAAGYKCAIFAFSVGNPDLPEDDRMADWQLVYPAIERAEENGHIIAVHQYGMPDLWGPDQLFDWYIHRLEHQVLSRLPFKKVQFAITEYGIDGLIQGPRAAGWQTFTDADDYVEQLLKCGRHLERFSGRILGYAVYTLGHFSPWGTYDIAGQVADLLADRSEKGTWAQTHTDSDIVSGSGDTTTAPDGEGEFTPPVDGGSQPPTDGPDEGEGGSEEPVIEVEPPTDGGEEPAGGETDGPDTGPETDSPSVPQIERRLAPAFETHNMQIHSVDSRPDGPIGDVVYVVKDIFTTRDGSWEPSDQPGAIVQWARNAYLKHEFLEAGADHHLLAAVIGLDGQLIKNHEIFYWSDGFEKLGDPEYNGYVRERTKESSSWANMFMAGGSSFAPERGESGPWCWAPAGASEVVSGGGMPLNNHISTFVVWQAVRREELESGEGGTQPDEGETEPTTPPPVQPEPSEGGTETQPVPAIDRRVGEWIEPFNIGLQPISARPDSPAGEIVYVLKDLFTTRDGSWEPSDKPGSVSQWARDTYLKPYGAPDYFDDAGGDHHLFAYVIGLDGQPVREAEIMYWSDGFEKLGDPDYTGYVTRNTKPHSGWANLVVGPGSNFVPERGESGPWCWAPVGAAEVVCGGGLPANQHVSTFAVWQAVRRAELGDETESGDERFSLFVPLLQRGAIDAPASRSTAPVARAAPPNLALMTELRKSAWTRIGVEFYPSSTLADYARRHGLGMPVTQEFRMGDFIVQAYYGGIVYAHKNNTVDPNHIAW